MFVPTGILIIGRQLPFLIGTLFPEIIYETSNLLSILSLGLIGVWLIEYSALFFAAINKNWLLNSRSVITFINNISLNLILIPKYGIYGAALGTTSALILTGSIILCLKKKHKKDN